MLFLLLMEQYFSLEEIDQVAEFFWQRQANGRVFAFHGDLGAGKTTFIKALCKVKGIKEVTSSPTFSLVNEYVYVDEGGHEQHIYHLDMYRIRDEEEAIQAGIEDYLYSDSICLIEWPEKITGLLPEDTRHVSLVPTRDGRKLIWQE